MNGVLILAHGSKRVETEKTLIALIDKLREKMGEGIIVPAYLQFSEQNLEAGITTLINKGVNNIKIIPLFLFEGIHVTEDIPNELEAIRKKHADIEIKMSSHLGDDERIADILMDRINSLS